MAILQAFRPTKRDFLQALLMGVVFGGIFALTIGSDTPFFTFTANLMLFLFLSLGNGYILRGINISWIEEPVKRFFVSLLLTTIYTPIGTFVAVSIVCFIWYGYNPIETFQGMKWDFYFWVFVITYLISFFLSARSFLMNWRQSEIRIAESKEAQTAAQYESLQNQVNPHFLFNSLNVLSTLVYKDQDLAAKFIKQLSVVYRYVLQVKDQQIVSLATELEALEAYIFLIQLRFPKGLQIENQLPKSEDVQVLPLSLQMLLENAIKHNSIGSNAPLKICLSMTKDYIQVKNNLQRKNNQQNSMGVGLDNIKKRYQYLSSQDILIEESKHFFIVKLPIINRSTILAS
ncbi:MAG: histidine kinase [Bacteroidota bacterium]